MNYLAHLYLSGENEDIKIGNFIADAVKGKLNNQFSEEIQKGIILHREIDKFTDTHPVFIKSKQKLNAKSQYKYFAGIVIDIFYDHFLSKYWNQYSNIPLNQFTNDAYNLMLANFSVLPEQVKYFLPYMVRNNWLKLYGEISGIERVLNGLSKRTSLPEKTEFAISVLNEHYNEFREEFQQFFTDIRYFVEKNKGIELKIHV